MLKAFIFHKRYIENELRKIYDLNMFRFNWSLEKMIEIDTLYLYQYLVPHGSFLLEEFYKLMTGADITKVGKGNTGATNVLGSSGPSLGLIALLLDMLKL